MELERAIGRVHAEQLAATRRRSGPGGVRTGLAASLHRLADRIEPRLRSREALYDG